MLWTVDHEMSSIHKNPNGTWRVMFRTPDGQRQKTFKSLSEAKKFAAVMELTPAQKSSRLTVAQLIDQYLEAETPKKRGARQEAFRLEAFKRRPFAQKTLSEITRADIQAYIDERQTEDSKKYEGTISGATIHKEMSVLHPVFTFAIKRGLMSENPCSNVDMPKPNEHRERVATAKDIEALLTASGWDGKSVPDNLVKLTVCAFLFACKTGMRSGEILGLEEAWIEGRVIHLPKEATKTATRRDVALSREALELLNLARKRGDRPRIFGALTPGNRDALWRKVRDRAGLGIVQDSRGNVIREGLNFHDSRATFATWAASPNPKTGAPRLDVLALARQTGHKNLKMLQRYYRASAEAIADMLDED